MMKLLLKLRYKLFPQELSPDDANEIERQLQAWGEKVRYTASVRGATFRIERSTLWREILTPYRLWSYTIHMCLVLLVVTSFFLVWRERSSPEQVRDPNSFHTLPIPKPTRFENSGLWFSWNIPRTSPPLNDAETRRLHTLLSSIQQKHETCGVSSRLDYSEEFSEAQRLIRRWSLSQPAGSDLSMNILRQLNHILTPCINPKDEKQLQQWVSRMKQRLFLTAKRGEFF